MALPIIDFNSHLIGHRPMRFRNPFGFMPGYEPPYWIRDRKLFDSIRKESDTATAASLRIRLYLGMLGLDVVNNAGLIRTEIKKSRQVTKLVVSANAPVMRNGMMHLAGTPCYVSNRVIMEMARTDSSIIPGISINPLATNAEKELAELLAESASLPNGGKVVFNLYPSACLFHASGVDETGNVMSYRDRLYAFYDKLAASHLPVIVHGGAADSLRDSQNGYPQEHAAGIEKLGYLIDTGATVILAQLGFDKGPGSQDTGGPDPFQAAKEILRTYPNVYADISRAFSPHHGYVATIVELLEDKDYRQKLVHGSGYPAAPGNPVLALESLKKGDPANPHYGKAEMVCSSIINDKSLRKLTALDKYARMMETAMQSLGVDQEEIREYFTNGARLLDYQA